MSLNIPYKQSSGFSTSFHSSTVLVAAASSGTLATITPPAGKKARLTHLVMQAGPESNISVTVGGATVVNDKILEDSAGVMTTANTFKIGVSNTNSATSAYIEGDVDQVIEIIKTTGSLGFNLFYAYEFGE